MFRLRKLRQHHSLMFGTRGILLGATRLQPFETCTTSPFHVQSMLDMVHVSEHLSNCVQPNAPHLQPFETCTTSPFHVQSMLDMVHVSEHFSNFVQPNAPHLQPFETCTTSPFHVQSMLDMVHVSEHFSNFVQPNAPQNHQGSAAMKCECFRVQSLNPKP